MLAVSMAPLSPLHTNALERALEAFACVYWASYEDVAANPRSDTSMRRSYGMDRFFHFPRIPNGRPAWALMLWDGPDVYKAVIAIEGAMTTSQITNCRRNAFATFANPLTGMFFGTFVTQSAIIQAEMAAHTQLHEAWIDRRYKWTYAGFSLGAALAEMLAEFHSAAFPSDPLELFKFASPRVGNSRYIRLRSRNILRRSYYNGNDPIDVYPSASAALDIGIWPPQGAFGHQQFASDECAERFTWEGETLPPFHEGGIIAMAQYADRLNGMNHPSSPWYDHLLGSYRYMLAKKAFRQSDEIRARFHSWEGPNENNFQWGMPIHNYDDYGFVPAVQAPAPAEWQLRDYNMNSDVPEPYQPDTRNGAHTVGGWDADVPGTSASVIPTLRAEPPRVFTPMPARPRRR